MFNLLQSPRINLLYVLNLENLLCIYPCKSIEFFLMITIIVPINYIEGPMPGNFIYNVDFNFIESNELLYQISPFTTLLLTKHGDIPSNPAEWIRTLQRCLILLGVVSNDHKRLPSTEVEAFLKSYLHLCTDRNGWLEINTDGKRMWVEVERR